MFDLGPETLDWTLLIIAWLTLALINAALAQGKSRRGGVWFLLSLILGPVATLSLTLLPPGKRRLF